MDGYRKRNKAISSEPANDDWKPEPWTRKPAKSTRKEFPTAPCEPEELGEGYFASLLADTSRFLFWREK